jgi:D-amino-acid dehydrogenase
VKIAVVGAGLAGLCAARALLHAGVAAADVMVFERRAGPGLETSFANGALLHPSAVEPWNSPGILGVLVRSLGDAQAPVLLRASALPSLLGWGLRFLRESSAAKHRAHTEANIALALRSVALMKAWRAGTGGDATLDDRLDYGRPHAGSLVVHRDRAAFQRSREHAAWLQDHGVASRAISRDELLAIEPALKPIADALAGGVLNQSDESGDAYRFCQALAARLAAQGVAFRWSTEVRSLTARGGRVTGLTLADSAAQGETLAFDAVVLAAAWWSVALTRPLGLRLPIRPVKGYSITLPLPEQAEGGTVPRAPVIDSDLHVAIVPLPDARLRVAGTAEFCGEDREVNPARIANLLQLVRAVYPHLAAHAARAPRQDWTGLRPMCSDGKPLVGATRVAGLFLNTGHGQIGWTTGAASAELLASHVTGRAPAIDPQPFLPARYGL